jgi:hypothetical protein
MLRVLQKGFKYYRQNIFDYSFNECLGGHCTNLRVVVQRLEYA